MKNTQLTNLTITKKAGAFGDYFIIYDNDNNEAYFVFANKLKNNSLWNELQTKSNTIKQLWLEYEKLEKGNQVTNLEIIDKEEEFFI